MEQKVKIKVVDGILSINDTVFPNQLVEPAKALINKFNIDMSKSKTKDFEVEYIVGPNDSVNFITEFTPETAASFCILVDVLTFGSLSL